MSNAIYKKDLHDVALAVAQGSKDYTDNSIEKLKWELGTYDLSVTTDSTVAYTKTIPANTIKGRLNYIGGASEVSENLILLNDFDEYSRNGLTIKVLNNVIYINGTTTSGFNLGFLLKNSISIDTYSSLLKIEGTTTNNNNWLLSTSTDSGSDFNFGRTDNNKATNTTTQVNTHIRTYIGSGVNYTNYQVKFMLVKGTTAPTEFKQGFEGMRSAKTTSVKFEGNLFDKDNYTYYNGYIDGSGTKQRDTNNSMVDTMINAIPNQTYTLSVNASQYGMTVSFYNNDTFISRQLSNRNISSFTFTTPENCNGIKFFINHNQATIPANYLSTIEPMLYKGSTTPTSYVPYIAPITKAIPSEIQALEGYGQSNPEDSTKFNYIDFDKKIYVELGYIDENDEWQELTTPVETDISQYIDDDFKNIDTTYMGTITFENEFEYDVPSEIDYLIEEVKA